MNNVQPKFTANILRKILCVSYQQWIRSSSYSSTKTYWHGLCINKLKSNSIKILKTKKQVLKVNSPMYSLFTKVVCKETSLKS